MKHKSSLKANHIFCCHVPWCQNRSVSKQLTLHLCLLSVRWLLCLNCIPSIISSLKVFDVWPVHVVAPGSNVELVYHLRADWSSPLLTVLNFRVVYAVPLEVGITDLSQTTFNVFRSSSQSSFSSTFSYGSALECLFQIFRSISSFCMVLWRHSPFSPQKCPFS